MNCIPGTKVQTKDHSYLPGFGRWTVARLLAILAGAFNCCVQRPGIGIRGVTSDEGAHLRR